MTVCRIRNTESSGRSDLGEVITIVQKHTFYLHGLMDRTAPSGALSQEIGSFANQQDPA